MGNSSNQSTVIFRLPEGSGKNDEAKRNIYLRRDENSLAARLRFFKENYDESISRVKNWNFFDEHSPVQSLSNIEDSNYLVRGLVKDVKDDLSEKKYSEKDVENFIRFNDGSVEAGILTTVLTEYTLENQEIESRDDLSFEGGSSQKEIPLEKQSRVFEIESPLEKQARVFEIASNQKYGFLGFEKGYLMNTKRDQAQLVRDIDLINPRERSGAYAINVSVVGESKDDSLKRAIGTSFVDAVSRDRSLRGAKYTRFYGVYAASKDNSLKSSARTSYESGAKAMDRSSQYAVRSVIYPKSTAEDKSFGEALSTRIEGGVATDYSFSYSKNTRLVDGGIAQGHSMNNSEYVNIKEGIAEGYSLENSSKVDVYEDSALLGNSLKGADHISVNSKNIRVEDETLEKSTRVFGLGLLKSLKLRFNRIFL